MKNSKMNNGGFSLVELIVVIAIMAVLVGVLAPTLIGNIEKSREAKDLQNLDSIRQAVVTSIADEATWNQVMSAMGTNSVISWAGTSGGKGDITFSGASELSNDFAKIITGDYAMSSTAGKSGQVTVAITKDGAVAAYVTGTYTAAGAATGGSYQYAPKSKKVMVSK